MVVSQMTLGRQEELLLIAARELRPALAVGDSPVRSPESGLEAVLDAVRRHLMRPADRVAAYHLGVHWTSKMKL